MELSKEANDLIDKRVKDELFRLLKIWGSIIGLTNLAVVLSAILYIFFPITPKYGWI